MVIWLGNKAGGIGQLDKVLVIPLTHELRELDYPHVFRGLRAMYPGDRKAIAANICGFLVHGDGEAKYAILRELPIREASLGPLKKPPIAWQRPANARERRQCYREMGEGETHELAKFFEEFVEVHERDAP
jgi:hypothetical protein